MTVSLQVGAVPLGRRPPAFSARHTTLPTRRRQLCVHASEQRPPLVQAQSTSRRRLLGAVPPCACAVCAAAASAAGEQRPRNVVLDQMFAEAMATGMDEYEASITPVKRRLFDQLLRGLGGSAEHPAQLLELGIGTGPNLQYYTDFYSTTASSTGSGNGSAASASSMLSSGPKPPPLHITGVDPNSFMLPFLEESLQRSAWPRERFTWVQGSAEQLPLPDASCDAVVCTLVLCSVPNVPLVLEEVARVLKPDGSLLFIEHTRAPQGQPLLRVAQWALEPLQRLLADGCHLTRDPLPLIQSQPGFQGGVEAMRFSVEGASLIAPHVAGLATRNGSGSSNSQGEA